MKRLMTPLLIGLLLIGHMPIQPAFAYRQIPLGGAGTADLAVNLFGPDQVRAGDRFTYSVIMTNNGPATASNISLSYKIPQGISWEGAQKRNQLCRLAGNTIVCDYRYLASSQSATIKIDLKATPSVTLPRSQFCPRTIESQVNISASPVDFDSVNNTSPILRTKITCFEAPRETRRTTDVSVKLNAPQTIAAPGSLSYAVIVGNGGSVRATHMTVSIPTPSGVTFYQRASSNECQLIGNEVVCTNFGLASGESRVLNVVFSIPKELPCGTDLSTRATTFNASYTSGSQTRTSTTTRTKVGCKDPRIVQNDNADQPPQKGYGNTLPSIQKNPVNIQNSVYNGSWQPILGDICGLNMGSIFPCPGSGRQKGGRVRIVQNNNNDRNTNNETDDDNGVNKDENEEEEKEDKKEDAKQKDASNKNIIPSIAPDNISKETEKDSVTTILPPDHSGRWIWDGKKWTAYDPYRGKTISFFSHGRSGNIPYLVLPAPSNMGKLPSTGADLY